MPSGNVLFLGLNGVTKVRGTLADSKTVTPILNSHLAIKIDFWEKGMAKIKIFSLNYFHFAVAFKKFYP